MPGEVSLSEAGRARQPLHLCFWRFLFYQLVWERLFLIHLDTLTWACGDIPHIVTVSPQSPSDLCLDGLCQ